MYSICCYKKTKKQKQNRPFILHLLWVRYDIYNVICYILVYSREINGQENKILYTRSTRKGGVHWTQPQTTQQQGPAARSSCGPKGEGNLKYGEMVSHVKYRKNALTNSQKLVIPFYVGNGLTLFISWKPLLVYLMFELIDI
jgi:hypothetical protein